MNYLEQIAENNPMVSIVWSIFWVWFLYRTIMAGGRALTRKQGLDRIQKMRQETLNRLKARRQRP